MDKRYPLAYLLSNFLGLDSTNRTLNRWKTLLRKSSVPIILDCGNWIIKEKDFSDFLKEREHCFKLKKEKIVRITKLSDISKHPTAVSGSDSLQKLLIAKRHKAKLTQSHNP